MQNYAQYHCYTFCMCNYSDIWQSSQTERHQSPPCFGLHSCFLSQGLGGLRLLHLLSASQDLSLRPRAIPLASLALRCSDLTWTTYLDFLNIKYFKFFYSLRISQNTFGSYFSPRSSQITSSTLSSQIHVLFFLIYHRVQFVSVIYSWVWGHPLEHGQHNRAQP